MCLDLGKRSLYRELLETVRKVNRRTEREREGNKDEICDTDKEREEGRNRRREKKEKWQKLKEKNIFSEEKLKRKKEKGTVL